ncbi:MAG TPA: adenylate/guanylate cyclase domain-containing protein [Pyrinomonadaceae bacterium]|nr:adenylate/guanylate cyclase domain-containing protein [Pyrinomonadaceae bacterium]
MSFQEDNNGEPQVRSVVRRYAKYIFLDVVSFSKRSAEAQSDIVNQLNAIVRQALNTCNVSYEDCIFLPTGDGMCVALIGTELPYDIHLQMALKILELLDSYTNATENPTRRFQVRIGINQNTDIIVTDINDRKNIAGAGINMAARIMDQADGNQILISQTVFEELQPSEHYMGSFRAFSAVAKHNLRFQVHQYVGARVGLNIETPLLFVPPPEDKQELAITKRVAYYLGLAIKNRAFIAAKYKEASYNQHCIQVLLYLLSRDAEAASNATGLRPAIIYSKDFGKATFKDNFSYYNAQDTSIMSILSQLITSLLSGYDDLFHIYEPLSRIFVNGDGQRKLKEQWPSIWKELELDHLPLDERGLSR